MKQGLRFFLEKDRGIALLARFMLTLAAGVLLLVGQRAAAQTMPTLYESRAGNINFAGTQRTLRTATNNSNACSVLSSGTTTQASISGVPAGATVEAAYLYWAGSGSNADFNVTFDGSYVSAPANRRYTAISSSGYRFFSGVVDVTATVAAKGGGTGNGTYSFSGLSVDAGSTYCSPEVVLAGWSLLVIYSHPSEEFRVLNLYEGFQTFQNSSFTLNLSNFSVPATFTKGRIAHLTWEGDPTLSGGGENLTFNGTTMSNGSNPIGNQFNSVSTIKSTPDTASHGIDFDVYDLMSPIIQAGQTTATTTYRSGQDLVLLSAEIVAMPNVPVSDLAISMIRSGSMQLGQGVSYSISVTNNGPNAEPGPITVTDTLPSQVNFVAATGTDWSCSSSGGNVTCTYANSLAVGATTPALTISTTLVGASPTAVTNSASVTGMRFDNVAANNTATDTSNIFLPEFVFTDGYCVDGEPFGSSRQTCNLLNWGVLTAGTDFSLPVHLTRLDDGVPRRVTNGRWGTLLEFQFALSCHNPSSAAGVAAYFSAVGDLPLCTNNGAEPTTWSASTWVYFFSGSPSSFPYTFRYDDVGRIELFMREGGSGGADGTSGPFVVKPHTFVLSGIRCTTANAANCGSGALPSGNNPAATGATGPSFIRAGHPFSVTVTAQNSAGNPTPNFGREAPAESVGLSSALVAAGGTANPAVGGDFGSFVAGVATGSSFRWSEVGIIRLTPQVKDGDYLGAGNVVGAQSGNIGRFYPHHFGVAGSVQTRSDIPLSTTTGSITGGSTLLTVASSADIAKGHTLQVDGAGPGGTDLSASVVQVAGSSVTLSAPASSTVSGAVVTKPADEFTYMGEPMRLQLQVTAYSASDTVTQNYMGSFARLSQAGLGTGSSWFATGCSASTTCMGLGAVDGATALTARLGFVSALPDAWAAGVGLFTVDVLLTRPLTSTPDATWGPYDALRLGAAPRDQDGVTLPTLASDAAHGMDLDANIDGVSERRELLTTQVRLGRLRIMSAHGSERQPLPIGVSIQYWNGSNYVTNTLDNNSRFVPGNVVLANYLGNLAGGETSVLASPPKIALAGGVGRYVLAKPSGGDGQYGGSVDMNVDLAASGLGYLVGNVARARFGVFKGSRQFIYMRENF